MPRNRPLVLGTSLAITATLMLALLGGRATATTTVVKSANVINDSSLQLSQPNESPRAVAICPGNKVPYGGAMSATPPPDSDGEGVYPHSYERLGAQAGWHTTPVLFDPTPGRTRSYRVTLQVLCGKKPAKLSDPRAIALNMRPGESKTLIAKCPRKRVLIGGGFNAAAFTAQGGVFPTESHAISKNKWQLSGTALPGFSTDLVAVGYCIRSHKQRPLLSEVSASASIAPGQVGRLTTPPCPDNRRLVSSGFDTMPKQALFFADGYFNPDQSFSASAYNRSRAPATLTGFGYCLKPSVLRGSLKKLGKR
jgi:hypothetical protein